MINLLIALVLSSSSVADEVSIFVAEPHEHAWTDIYRTDELHLQYDANYSSDGLVNGQTYPIALVRIVSRSAKNADTPIGVAIARDARVAIDCENASSTPIDSQIWNREKGEYEIQTFAEPQFQALRPENKELLAPLYRHVCGANWTPEGNP